MHNRYMKYAVPYTEIYDILKRTNKRRIRFFIDLQSIAKGLYNQNNIFHEIQHYITHREPSDTLVTEYRNFLNTLYMRFKQYSPYMVTFYDDGKNSQNTLISSGYKGGRTQLSSIITDDGEREVYYQIKQLYFTKIEHRCSVDGFGKVYYLKDYESDFIPYYCIVNNLYDTQADDVLNVIFAADKDLLQCCIFNNTIQITNRFLPSQIGDKRLNIEVWNDKNAITYIYRNFKQGVLTSKYIPLILAIAGDKADNIPGIKGVGPKKAIDYIQNYNMPCKTWELQRDKDKLPGVIQKNFDLVIRNLKMIDFEEQLKRTSVLKNKGVF